MNDWINCNECGEEFRIISDSHDHPQYCPYCAEPLEDQNELSDWDSYE